VSRLVYDCNRPPEAASAIIARSEAHRIPGNEGLDAQARRRGSSLFTSRFRRRFPDTLQARAGRPTVLVTIHSFTRVFNGVQRDVELGILCDRDERLADAMLARAPGLTDMLTAKNDPYGPADGVTHTLKEHGLSNGLLNVMIEVRNDLLRTTKNSARSRTCCVRWSATALPHCAGRGCMTGFMHTYIRVVDGFNRKAGPLHHVRHLRDDGHPALVLDHQDVLHRADALDAGNGAVRHGRLLHSRRALLDPDGLERPHGPVLWRVVGPAESQVDALTVFCLILLVLIYGLASLAYSLGYWDDKPLSLFGVLTGSEEIGRLERRPWRPYMWPIKLIMVIGIFLMLLQAMSEFFKDILRLRRDEEI
jgi:hypothetical protein